MTGVSWLAPIPIIVVGKNESLSSIAVVRLDDAEAFLEENAHHNGIVQLEEGKLQFRVDQEGEGASVAADATPATDYTVFVHVLDSAGNVVGGQDNQPVGNRYPTTIWSAGEKIVDPYLIPTAGLPPAAGALPLPASPTDALSPLPSPLATSLGFEPLDSEPDTLLGEADLRDLDRTPFAVDPVLPHATPVTAPATLALPVVLQEAGLAVFGLDGAADAVLQIEQVGLHGLDIGLVGHGATSVKKEAEGTPRAAGGGSGGVKD